MMKEKIRLRRVHGGEGMISPCDGKRLVTDSSTVVSFKSLGWYLDPPYRLENRPALLKRGTPTKATHFISYDILQSVMLNQVIESLSINPQNRVFQQDQILALVSKHKRLLTAKNRSSLFPLKENGKIVFLNLEWRSDVRKFVYKVHPWWNLIQETFLYPCYQFRVFVTQP